MSAKQHGNSQLSRSVQRWVGRHLPSLRHERRVERLAEQLLELTADQHELNRDHAQLLRLAAYLHDVGRSVDTKRHPMVGAAMILKDESLPLNDMQRRQLAYLTRYHRGAVPRAGYDEILRPGDGRKPLRRVLALLRAADTLDHRQLPVPRVRMSWSGSKLSIDVTVATELSIARKAFARRKKFRLFEETLDCKVEIRVREAARVR